MNEKAVTAIRRARYCLLKDKPFFGQLALHLVLREVINDPHVQTMGVTPDDRLLFNPEFVLSQTPNDLVFVVAHEVVHKVQGCFQRMPLGADQKLWNLACDITDNIIVNKMGLEFPKYLEQNMMTPEIVQRYENSYTEEVYRDLLKRALAQSSGSGKSGKNGKNGGIPENPLKCEAGCQEHENASEQQESQERWKQRVVSAAEAAKSQGKGDLPGFVNELLAEIANPKIPWQRVLRRKLIPLLNTRSDWRRQSRRSHALGFFMPNRRHTKKAPFFCVDTSGSVSDEDLSAYMTEIFGVLKLCGVQEAVILFHSVMVHNIEVIKIKEGTVAIPAERGGTSHRDVFAKIEEMKMQPSLLIGLTDLESDIDCIEPPQYPVIWAYKNGREMSASFGEVIRIED